jgi:hypothetical protein
MWDKLSTSILRESDSATRKLLRPKNIEAITSEHVSHINKIIKEYRLPEFLAPPGAPPSRIAEKFTCKTIYEYVLSRKKEEAFTLLKVILSIPLHPSTRAHLWVASLLGLSEAEVREEVELTRRNIGSQSKAWDEIQRVLRCQLISVQHITAIEYLREIAGIAIESFPLPSVPTFGADPPISLSAENCKQSESHAASFVIKTVICYGCSKPFESRVLETVVNSWCPTCYPKYLSYLHDSNHGKLDYHEAFTSTGIDRKLAYGVSTLRGDGNK